MEDWIKISVRASKNLDTGDLDVIRKHIERRAGNMIVDPVNGPPVAGTRVGFQVVNPHTSGRPRRDLRISVIHPDLAPLIARGGQMYGNYECPFSRNRRGLLREAVLAG